MRQVQRRGDVRQAAVHADDAGASGQAVGQLAQVQPGPDAGALTQRRGQALRALQLGVAGQLADLAQVGQVL